MKSEINYGKKNRERTNMWKLNNMLLRNKWVKDGIKEEIIKYLEIKENENTLQNLWRAAKAILKGESTAIQAFLKKQENFQMNNLTNHLKGLVKEKQSAKSAEGRK